MGIESLVALDVTAQRTCGTFLHKIPLNKQHQTDVEMVVHWTGWACSSNLKPL